MKTEYMGGLADRIFLEVPSLVVWSWKIKNVRTTIKNGAALVLNERLWCGVNTENSVLIRVLVPASCPWKNCQRSRGGGKISNEPLGRVVQIRATSSRRVYMGKIA